MTDLLLTDGDLVFEGGRLQLVDGLAEVGQRIRIALTTERGDWFRDTQFGVPYHAEVLVKNPNLGLLQSVLRTVVRDVTGVTRVQRMDLSLADETRVLTVDGVAIATDGQPVPITVGSV